MNLQFKPAGFKPLPTNRTPLKFYIRCGLTIGILFIVDSFIMARDLNTIVAPYTKKKASMSFFDKKTFELINEELARRGLNYQLNLTSAFSNASFKVFTALNLLCEDYNKRGC